MIPLSTRVFDLHGIAFAAWTLAAFAIGVLAGMLIRRVVPAIAATLAVYAGLALATTVYLREHYMAPLLTSQLNLPGSAWVVSQWYAKDGRFAFPSRGSQLVSAFSRYCPGNFNGSPAQCLVPARLHAVEQLSARQPVLALPVDRRRLAARAVGAAHRRHCLAGPPPRRLTYLDSTRPNGSGLDVSASQAACQAGSPGYSSVRR